MASARLKIFFDGGCRPDPGEGGCRRNPGRIEAAVVVRGVVHLFDDLGFGTSSDAEWLALIRALELTHRLGLTGVGLIGDAADVIQQANRALKDSHGVQGHAATFLALAASGPPARIGWIRRGQNLAGIALAARHPR